MKDLPKNSMLEYCDNTLEEMRKKYGFDTLERMNEAIDILDEWVRMQHHFVKKDFTRRYLEATLIICKGSIEKSKARIDKMCTFRTLLPQFFGDFDVKNDFKDIFDIAIFGPLPKMTLNHQRIVMMKVFGDQFLPTLILQAFRLCFVFAEYLKLHEYADGFIIIADYRDANIFEIVKNINPIDLRNAFTILMEGVGCRIPGIHMVTTSKYVELLVTLLKQAVSPKLRDRLFVHKSVESLHDLVPRKLLPKEYGGEEKSLKEIQDLWIEELSTEQFRKYLRIINGACTNEKLRQTDVFNDQYMGMPGSFRSLTVD